ncbi:phosphomannomutase/phosphoglucomutase [Aurantivibrio plasticivorans]
MLKNTKKQAAPKDNPKAEDKTSREPLSAWTKLFAVFVLVAVLINGAGGYWAYDTYVIQVEKNRLNELAQEYATSKASTIARYLRDLEKAFQRFADQELLVSAAEDNEQETFNRLADLLRIQEPRITTLRLFPYGSASLEPNASPPIRFAEIDMINRAEKREPVFPEASQYNGAWQLALARPVPYSKPETTENERLVNFGVKASLFVTLDAGEMMSKLNDDDESQGHILLQQVFDTGKPQPLVQFGQGNAGETQTAKVENSYWEIVFTPSNSMARQINVSSVAVLSGVALTLLASLLAAYLAANIFSRKAMAKAEQLQAAQRASEEARSETSFIDPLHRSKKLAEVEIRDEDANLVNTKDEEDPLDIADALSDDEDEGISSEIFRAYDIRGIVKTHLPPANVVAIGRAIGSEVIDSGDNAIVVGRDGRTHSPDVSEQLIEGILSTGCNVINIGMVPTPVVYYAINELDSTNSGVVVTASHNPAEYNGFKIVVNNETLAGDRILALRTRILQESFKTGTGREDFSDLSFQYVERIFSDVALAGDLKVVVDAGNGVAGELAPRVFDEIGCEVVPLYCQVDGTFPNHEADPSVYANLQDLVQKVQEVGADLGVALDGDGDRVGVVTATGQIIAADRLLMLLAKDIVSRNPGADVLFDVKCSRDLTSVITSYGGRPVMWKTGHSHMKAKMRETGALLGGELSGHIFIKERWYGFDDGIYAAARIMEIMSLREQSLDEIFEAFPALPATPEIKVSVAEDRKFKLIQKLIADPSFKEGKLTTIDGLRVDYASGWGLARASNTSPAITLRFEGESEEALQDIQQRFKQALLAIDPSLKIPY